MGLTAILLAIVQSADTAADPGDWAKSVKPMGWSMINTTAERVVFAKSGPEPGQLWLRREYRKIDHGVKSAMTLEEFDCAAQRHRGLAIMAFGENNLIQPLFSARVVSTPSGSWIAVAPGSNGEDELKAACMHGKPG
ncbi:MAG: hypothetical protein EOO81_05470 [Oxalobacteraceae bacterium]|nr:MAG: hypothetical protein EOO81_05470 [Oxalobacteraceae bacterium]